MLKMLVKDKDLRPVVGTKGSAGYDLKMSNNMIILDPGVTGTIYTGVRVEIPEGYAGVIVPRSSTGKKRIAMTNTIGIIDSDYRGEIRIPVVNQGRESFVSYKGDRLFQLVIIPVFMEKIMFVDKFDETTERGEKGFGSTGSN